MVLESKQLSAGRPFKRIILKKKVHIKALFFPHHLFLPIIIAPYTRYPPPLSHIDLHHKGPRSRSRILFFFNFPIHSTRCFIGACRRKQLFSFPLDERKLCEYRSAPRLQCTENKLMPTRLILMCKTCEKLRKNKCVFWYIVNYMRVLMFPLWSSLAL